MSRDDLINLKGVVTQIFSGGFMKVECDKGVEITGKLSGKMKKNRISVTKGDTVQIEVSPYNLGLGIITFRF